MGQNIVNCVTWLWGGWLSAHPLLFYLLSSHPFIFSCFCHLLFLSSVSISPLSPPFSQLFWQTFLLFHSFTSCLIPSHHLFLAFRLSSQLLSPYISSLHLSFPPFISSPLVINPDRQDMSQASSLLPFNITYERLTYLRKSIIPKSMRINLHNIDLSYKSQP